MSFERLECVVLTHDIPERALEAGDLGVVVEVYPQGELEVEFVTGSGETVALVTLSEGDLRRIDARDLLATRRLAAVK